MSQHLRMTEQEYAARVAKSAAPVVTSLSDKPRKYRNVPTVVDSIEFPSRKQAKVYRGLVLRQQTGEIRDLQLEQTYSLDVNGIHVCDYRADYTYRTTSDNQLHVVDAKGMRTREFIIKQKLMKAIFGVDIEVV